ncbi:MAG: hypothetical protein IPJ09_21115 [Saprospiraceae bacterium]|nr:hypothetical protein [Saprospiraceae bacterium]
MKINIFNTTPYIPYRIVLQNEKAPATADPAPTNSEWVELISGKDMTG